MISTFVVVTVVALVLGWRLAGLKSAVAFIVAGMFLASTGFGVATKSTIQDITKKGGDTVTSITNPNIKGK